MDINIKYTQVASVICSLFYFGLFAKQSTLTKLPDSIWKLTAQKNSVGILVMLAAQYGVSALNPDMTTQVRQLTWIVTAPLLLLTYYSLAAADRREKDALRSFWVMFVSAVAMAWLYSAAEHLPGWAGHGTLALAMSFYGIIIWQVSKTYRYFKRNNLPEHANLAWFIMVGWSIYPMVFYAPEKYKNWILTFTDVITKGFFLSSVHRLT